MEIRVSEGIKREREVEAEKQIQTDKDREREKEQMRQRESQQGELSGGEVVKSQLSHSLAL